MQTIISARNFELSEPLKEYTEAKMEKLGKEYNKLNTVRVVLSREHNEDIVEAQATGKHLNLDASASSHDMNYSVDLAYEKLEKQLQKRLSRIKDHSPPQKHAEEVKNQGALFTETGGEQ